MLVLTIATLATALLLATALYRQHRLTGRLRDELRRVEAGRSFAALGTWDWAVDQDELHWSDEVYPMFGFAPRAVKPSYALFCSLVHPDDSQRVREGELRCLEGEGKHDTEYRVIHADGTIRWLRETGNVVRDRDGRPIRMIGMVRDITGEKEREEQIMHLAFHDGLTGLPNRVYLRALLDDALARAQRENSGMALAFIDLNRFKPVNDAFGHATGDKVLMELAQRFRDGLRATDHVARVGGDEFVAILEGIAVASEAETVVNKLHQLVLRPMEIDGKILHVGASIGVSLYPHHAQTAEALLQRADEAMYEAKKAGDVTHFAAT